MSLASSFRTSRFALTLGLISGLALAPSAYGAPSAKAPKTQPTARRATARIVPPTGRSRPRTGPSPCMTPDPGFANYTPWEKLPLGQLIMPTSGGMTPDGQFDVVVHFHGHEAVRKEFVKTAHGQVLVGVDLGIGSGAYERAFESPAQFERLLENVEGAVARHHGRTRCHIRKLALSSWSAGYGAVWRILMQPAAKRVDALILLDSVHAGYLNGTGGALKPWQLDPFVQFARSASDGRTFMFLSHSAIRPPGYASTREVAEAITQRIDGSLRAATPRSGDPLGLELYARYDRQGLHIRGFGGNDKPDHCAHLGLMADVMKVHLGPRWSAPPGGRQPPKRTRR